MKKTFYNLDRFKLGHKLHQLQKRYARAIMNGYDMKIEDYKRKIEGLQEKLKNIKGHK